MTARKLSISVPPEVEETIRAAATEEGKPVATWLVEAAVEKAQTDLLHAQGRATARELVAEYESEHGKLPEESRQRAPVPHGGRTAGRRAVVGGRVVRTIVYDTGTLLPAERAERVGVRALLGWERSRTCDRTRGSTPHARRGPRGLAPPPKCCASGPRWSAANPLAASWARLPPSTANLI
ncbi:hypothetical protein ACQP2T_20530 [Nonomuraea sp. CA-143628]|uniref:hypothetical protein n=1 Tax=Nonomuraea sp. CA-143628 TaxID=3239997 RepID=UPI003D8CF63D